MKILKLTVLLFSFIIAASSCEREELEDQIVSNKNGLMTGGQEVPANPSTANGQVAATYDKKSKTLSYTITWEGLSGNVTGFHMHGATDPGFNAGILQSFSGYKNTPSGSYSGSVFADGVVIREEDILGGKMYINIHTALYPGGEIRGQINF